MSDIIRFVLSTLAGIVLFIYAIKMLSVSLKSVISYKLKKSLNSNTKHPVKGMLIGALTSAVTQSSSLAVLIVLSLVNSGVLTLERSVAIILGTEIGTTLTAQLTALDISWILLPIGLLGVAIDLRYKGENNKEFNIGKILINLGLLFSAVAIMKWGSDPLKYNEPALALFRDFANYPLLAFLIGLVFTAITSSSGATSTLLVTLGIQGVIDLKSAIIIILGARIGTCVLEIIVSLKSGDNAKRVAIIQLLINTVTVIIFLPLVDLVDKYLPYTSGNIGQQIANAHTIFSIITAIVLFNFTKQIAKLSKKIVKSEKLIKIS